MRRRLLTSMVLVATLAVVGFGVPLALAVRAQYRDQTIVQLSREANRAAAAVPGSFARDNDLPELPEPSAHVDVALYDADGRLVTGDGPAQADASVREAIRTAGQSRGRYIVAIPIADEELVVGAIRASTPAEAVASRVRRTWGLMALWAAAVLAAAALIAWLRSRSLTYPLAELRNDADILGEGGELVPRPSSGVSEIDGIQAALSNASGQLHEALARERSLSADLAHQLRTPLASLRLRMESEQHSTDKPSPLVSDTLRDIDRMQQTIDDLLTLARDRERAQQPHSLAGLVHEVVERWTIIANGQHRQLAVGLDPQMPWATVSAAAIRQILDVLVDNALTHGRGEIRVSAQRLGGGIVLAVSDEGPAVLDAHTIFDSEEPARDGHGFGLVLAQRLAAAHDMRLVLAGPGPGPVFHLIVPVVG